MGDLTYDEIRTEVLTEFYGRDDIDTVINNAIYQAYQDIATIFRHYELEDISKTNLVPGYRRYVLPTELRVIASVRDSTFGRKLRKTSCDVFDEMGTYPPGPPSRYARFGDSIEFDTTPSVVSEIHVRFIKKVTRFSGTQTTLLLPEWDEGIVLGAVYRGLERIKEYAQAETAKQRYIEFVTSRTDPKDIEDMDLDEPLGVRIE